MTIKNRDEPIYANDCFIGHIRKWADGTFSYNTRINPDTYVFDYSSRVSVIRALKRTVKKEAQEIIDCLSR